MRSAFRMVVAVGCMGLTAAVLTGCGTNNNDSNATGSSSLPPCLAPGQPTAIAVGARSNSPNPEYPPSALATLTSAANAHRMLSIIRLDGNPKILFSQSFTAQGANAVQQRLTYDHYVSTVNSILYSTSAQVPDIKAQSPQANVLEALTIAALEVPAGGNVIIIDSGLQTTEPLNFGDGLLDDDPQTIAGYLGKNGELPNLAGRHVDFVGLGWTAAPQPDLGTKYQNALVQIWESIAKAAHASCVWVDPTPNTSDSVAGTPAVAIVTPPPQPSVPAACSVINLNDSNNVGFVVDTATFLHPAAAHATIQQLANIMLHTGESVLLTGSTSSEGSESFNEALSSQRAHAVASVLEQLGVPASSITTVGDGSHLPGRLNDIGPNGQLLIGPAIANRKVVAKLRGASCPSS
jgi:OOP family OmpA-OmpF porin